MVQRRLFLIGGTEGDILDAVAEEFVPSAGRRAARIALLMAGGEGWERYVPRYVEPWRKYGATQHTVVVPGGDGVLDLPSALSALEDATGIFIAGGRTATYHALYASGPVRSLIRERHAERVPVAGLSAGALISPEVCLLRPTPRNLDQEFRIVEGLGLITGLVVEVHFDDGPGTLPTLLEGMGRSRTARGLGIGMSACAVFEGGLLSHALGRRVHSVTMSDFDERSYTIVEVASAQR
jgi:cyanophycinase